MARQPSYKPLEPSDFFADGRSARPLPEGTIARGHLPEDAIFLTGRSGKDFAASLPVPVSRELLERGKGRYEIFCAPCHDRIGSGEGMVVRRGYPKPPSFHIDRLRAAQPGYVFDVITRGFGRMPDYASQVPPKDRWAIVAYLRALQLSQNATVRDVPPGDLGRLETEGPAR